MATPRFRTTTRFDKQLKRKKARSPRLVAAVYEAMRLIADDPANRGLNAHRLQGSRVWEAYVTRAIRITYERDGDSLTFRNNCRHDIIDRRQW